MNKTVQKLHKQDKSYCDPIQHYGLIYSSKRNTTISFHKQTRHKQICKMFYLSLCLFPKAHIPKQLIMYKNVCTCTSAN